MTLDKILQLFPNGTRIRIHNKMSDKYVPYCVNHKNDSEFVFSYKCITKDTRMRVTEIIPLFHAEEVYIVTL